MTAEELKAKMGQGQRPKVKDFTLQTEAGPVELVIRRPIPSVAEELLSQAETLRNESTATAKAAIDFQKRVVAETIFAPGGVRPLYTAEEAGECAYLPELFKAAMPALADAVGKAVEDAKGN